MNEQTPSPYRPSHNFAQERATMNQSINESRRLARRRLQFGVVDTTPPPMPLPDATRETVSPRRIFFGSPTASPVQRQEPEMTPMMEPLKFREHSATPRRITAKCKSKFTHYDKVENPHAQAYLRKLMEICEVTAERCENPRAILSHLHQKFGRNHKTHTIIVQADQDMNSPFHQLYQYWAAQDAVAQPHVFRGLINYDEIIPRFSVRFRELDDIGAGVTRNFFQMVIDDMIYKQQYFVPLDGDKTNKFTRYTLNESQAHADPAVFKFIGEFLAFCLLNEIPIPIHFSRSLLARMIYKENEIDDDMDVMYMITDYPETSQTVLNELMFSEYLDLDESADAMKGTPSPASAAARFEKVKAYVRARARRASVTPSVKLVAGAFFLRNDARRHNWNIDRLDQLISGNIITAQSIDTLIAHLKSESNPKTADATKNVVKMLEKGKRDLDFVQHLMQFWSGMKKIDVTMQPSYQVIPMDKGLPMASTCFNQLKVPMDVVNEEDLIARVKAAIELTGTTFGMD